MCINIGHKHFKLSSANLVRNQLKMFSGWKCQVHVVSHGDSCPRVDPLLQQVHQLTVRTP